MDYMMSVGDEMIRLDEKLTSECAHLDSVVEKIMAVVNLPQPEGEACNGFRDTMEAYLVAQFEQHKIEKYYWDYLNTLQKYAALKDLLFPQRSNALNTTEPLCSICLTEAVTIVFAPCGHTFCQNCSKRTISCHMCRQFVTSRIRVYFG
jgi:hypothetical protein